jgi:hypothetical protein
MVDVYIYVVEEKNWTANNRKEKQYNGIMNITKSKKKTPYQMLNF